MLRKISADASQVDKSAMSVMGINDSKQDKT
jgi:hypothetical protein